MSAGGVLQTAAEGRSFRIRLGRRGKRWAAGRSGTPWTDPRKSSVSQTA